MADVIQKDPKQYYKFDQLLKQTGKTASQVSKDTDIATATLTSWKQGTYKPKIEKLMVLASYFEVPVNYFLSDD